MIMNTEPFTQEAVSETPTRRTSERRKVLTLIDKSFFKKTYKAKPLPSGQKVNKIGRLVLEPHTSKPCVYASATPLFFKFIKSDRRQSKAIETFRAKKLKQFFSSEVNLKELLGKKWLFGQYSYLSFQELRRKNPSRKSLYAFSRARDTLGRFNGTISSPKQVTHLSTADIRDECRTVTLTTADGSNNSLLSFDKSAENNRTPAQAYYDFDSLCGVSQPNYHDGLTVDDPDENMARVACDTRTNSAFTSLTQGESKQPHKVNNYSCLHKGLFWGIVNHEECSLGYPNLPNDMFTEYLEEDHVEEVLM